MTTAEQPGGNASPAATTNMAAMPPQGQGVPPVVTAPPVASLAAGEQGGQLDTGAQPSEDSGTGLTPAEAQQWAGIQASYSPQDVANTMQVVDALYGRDAKAAVAMAENLLQHVKDFHGMNSAKPPKDWHDMTPEEIDAYMAQRESEAEQRAMKRASAGQGGGEWAAKAARLVAPEIARVAPGFVVDAAMMEQALKEFPQLKGNPGALVRAAFGDKIAEAAAVAARGQGPRGPAAPPRASEANPTPANPNGRPEPDYAKMAQALVPLR